MSDLNIIHIVETENLSEFKKYVESKVNNNDVLNKMFANLFSDYIKIFYKLGDNIKKEYFLDKLINLLYLLNDYAIEFFTLFCAANAMTNILEKLINMGVDLNTPKTLPKYILSCYFAGNTNKLSLECTKLLLDNGSVSDMEYAFMKCCSDGNKNLCELIMNYGYIPNQSNPQFINCISCCITNDNVDILKIFLDLGFEINFSHDQIINAICNAIKFRKINVLTLLIDIGLIIDDTNPIILESICHIIKKYFMHSLELNINYWTIDNGGIERTNIIKILNLLRKNGVNFDNILKISREKNLKSSGDEDLIKILSNTNIDTTSLIKLLLQ
ncbi:ankyrin repeat protein [Acanthamoeba polyphaga moumouvirus]|uniref:Ankyrin repeat protein n=1 Tax=Acanthamoeba polyphaga moumouvirus TaxID=1269028 RepID=L7RCC4_9VIRU|nr:ankyrin repeat protein [Acanthamoeba polyphaga moumouvirus]AGC02229.1 ankyrin repeat protein [Acanthamoeba polyphaga moumouvirus]